MNLRLLQIILILAGLFIIFGLNIACTIKAIIILPFALINWFISIKLGDYKLKSYNLNKVSLIIILMLVGYIFSQSK